jgi:hypothetical protein
VANIHWCSAAVVGRDYSVQVWDVDTSQPIGVPFLTSATTIVVGFTPAGLIAVTANMPDPTLGHHITLLAPETGQQRANFTLPPAVGLDTELTNDGQLSIVGSGGRRPSTFPLEARQWADHLCRLIDRPFTEGEYRLLPHGTDTARPCER